MRSASEPCGGVEPGAATTSSRRPWALLNQSFTPMFQRMLQRLAGDLGPCTVMTGTVYDADRSGLTILPGPEYDRRRVRHRAVSWLKFTAFAFVQLLRLPRGTPVLAVTNPPLLPNVTWLASLLKGHPYALLIWDLYPDHVVQIGAMGERNLLVRAWRQANRWAYRRSTAVITIGEGLRGAIARQLGPRDAGVPLVVIPNWADVRTFRPIPKAENPFAREEGQVGKLTVMYSGNLGATHGVDTLAALARALRDDPRIQLLVVGEGLGHQALALEVAASGLENIRLLPLQPWSRLPFSLAAGDVAVVSQASGSEHLSVPSKTYSALAAGSAILAFTSPDSDLANLVRRHEVGVVCRDEDVEGAARELRRLADEPERLAALRANARRAATGTFSEDAIAGHFRSVLTAMSLRRGAHRGGGRPA